MGYQILGLLGMAGTESWNIPAFFFYSFSFSLGVGMNGNQSIIFVIEFVFVTPQEFILTTLKTFQLPTGVLDLISIHSLHGRIRPARATLFWSSKFHIIYAVGTWESSFVSIAKF